MFEMIRAARFPSGGPPPKPLPSASSRRHLMFGVLASSAGKWCPTASAPTGIGPTRMSSSLSRRDTGTARHQACYQGDDIELFISPYPGCPPQWIVPKPSTISCWIAGKRSAPTGPPSRPLSPLWISLSGVQKCCSGWHRIGKPLVATHQSTLSCLHAWHSAVILSFETWTARWSWNGVGITHLIFGFLFFFFSFFPLLSSPSVSRFLLTQLITKRNNQSATSPSQSLLFYDPHYAHFTSRNAQLTQHIQHPGHAHLCNATKYVGHPPLGLKSLTHRHPHSSSVLIPFPP